VNKTAASAAQSMRAIS